MRDNGLSFATAEQLGRALPRCARLRVITFPFSGLKEGKAAKNWDNTLAHDPTKLGLTGMELGPGGATAIAEPLKKLKKLATLELGHNNIGDAGARDLAGALKDLKGLMELNLS